MKFNLQNLLQILLVIGLPWFGTTVSAQIQPRLISLAKVAVSNVVYKERSITARVVAGDVQGTSLGRNTISGAGEVKLFGTLTVASGGGARVKLKIGRYADNRLAFFEEQTFEFCGTQQVGRTGGNAR